MYNKNVDITKGYKKMQELINDPQALYEYADQRATEAAEQYGDNGYGCGSTFVTIKWGTPFMRWAKKQGLVQKDAYYGWILDTDKRKFSATLTQEQYNETFASVLSQNGVHAFNHTYLS